MRLPTWSDSARLLHVTCAVPGYLSRPKLDPGSLVGTNRAVMGFNLIWLTERIDMLTAEMDEMFSKGGLLERPPAVGRSFPFEQLPDALHYLNSGSSVGKVVVEVEPAGPSSG